MVRATARTLSTHAGLAIRGGQRQLACGGRGRRQLHRLRLRVADAGSASPPTVAEASENPSGTRSVIDSGGAAGSDDPPPGSLSETLALTVGGLASRRDATAKLSRRCPSGALRTEMPFSPAASHERGVARQSETLRSIGFSKTSIHRTCSGITTCDGVA